MMENEIRAGTMLVPARIRALVLRPELS